MADAVARHLATAPVDESAIELRKEAYTMGLYVAICLLAALSAVAEHADRSEVDTFKIVWGTTLGLALAHWLAFRLSARLVAGGRVRRHDAEAAAGQLAGAAVVALIATIPVLVLPRSVEYDVARYVVAGLIGVAGYAVVRSGGGTRGRALAYGTAILVVGAVVAVVKNALAGH